MTTKQLSPEVLKRLRSYYSATVSNALEHFKVRDQATGYATNQLVCSFPGLQPMVGYALTCTADTTQPGDNRPSRVDKLVEAVAAAPMSSNTRDTIAHAPAFWVTCSRRRWKNSGAWAW